MALRDIVVIDEEKCNGCGLCVPSCAEGAIRVVDGKARLIREDYCDGLGACLGHCPQGALRIERREAAEFDEAAVQKHMARGEEPSYPNHLGCPGSRTVYMPEREASESSSPLNGEVPSELRQWPVELALVSPKAPYFADADLILAADCVPFAYGDFHRRFLRGRRLAVGCPKLDDVSSYIDKLADIIAYNNLRSLTIVHMEVPCCSGLVWIARQAMELSGKSVAVHEVVIGIDGTIVQD